MLMNARDSNVKIFSTFTNSFFIENFCWENKKIKYRIKTVTSERCNTHLNHSVKSNIPKKKKKNNSRIPHYESTNKNGTEKTIT